LFCCGAGKKLVPKIRFEFADRRSVKVPQGGDGKSVIKLKGLKISMDISVC
jgi:hypothetical protein